MYFTMALIAYLHALFFDPFGDRGIGEMWGSGVVVVMLHSRCRFIVMAGSVGDGWPPRHVFNVEPFGGLGDFSPSRIHFTKNSNRPAPSINPAESHCAAVAPLNTFFSFTFQFNYTAYIIVSTRTTPLAANSSPSPSPKSQHLFT